MIINIPQGPGRVPKATREMLKGLSTITKVHDYDSLIKAGRVWLNARMGIKFNDDYKEIVIEHLKELWRNTTNDEFSQHVARIKKEIAECFSGAQIDALIEKAKERGAQEAERERQEQEKTETTEGKKRERFYLSRRCRRP